MTPLEDNKKEVTSTREKQLDKSICDILNEGLTMRQQLPQIFNKIQFKKDSTALQNFLDQIDLKSDEFIYGYFQNIIWQRDAFINFIFKDTNEVWKFFKFIFQCIHNLPVGRVEFFLIQFQLIRIESPTKRYFEEKLFVFEILFARNMQFNKGKCVLWGEIPFIQIISAFQEPYFKHQVKSIMKLNLPTEHFIQSLAIFSVTQRELSELWSEIIRYDYIYLLSLHIGLSSSALAILANTAKVNTNKWWQNRSLLIILFSEIIRGIIKIPNYIRIQQNYFNKDYKFYSILFY